MAERLLRSDCEPRESQQHADTRCAETKVPTNFLTQKSSHKLTEKRTGVNAHVEERKAGVTSRTAFGIKVTDDRRNVWLQQSRTEHDQNQTDEERNFRVRKGREADRNMAGGNQHRAVHDRAAQTGQTVRHPPTGQ